MNRGSLLGHDLVDEVYQRENHPAVSFRAEALAEQFQVCLGVGFEGADRGHENETFLGETEM